MREREILGLAPRLWDRVQPLDLGEFPTPLTEEGLLARTWGLKSLHVKRDDLTSPHYGGTKVRALEYLLGVAKSSGAAGVVTLGPTGSHHALATAVFSNRAGLRCRVVLFPQPETDGVGRNREALARLGTEVAEPRTWIGVLPAWVGARLRRLGGERPAVVPPGGTSPLGLLGPVEGALEVAREVRAGHLPVPEAVLVAAGSCGTAAGLLLGFALASLPIPVVAVRVTPRVLASPWRVRHLARAGLHVLRQAGYRGCPTWGPLQWVGNLVGRGYARPTEAADRAVAQVACEGHFRAETTYTGKALAHLAEGRLSGRRVLFWHTYSAVDPPGPGG